MRDHFVYLSAAGDAGGAAGGAAGGEGGGAAGALAGGEGGGEGGGAAGALAGASGAEAIFGGDAAAAAAAAAENESIVPEWAKGFEDASTRGLIAKKQWQSPEAMLESYTSLESKLGTPDSELLRMKSIEDREAWHGKEGIFSRLGRPETSEGYEFPKIEAGEGEVDLSTPFAEHAFSLGLTKTQGQSIVEWFTENMGQATEQDAQTKAAKTASDLQSVKLEWGDLWDSNTKIAKMGMAALGIDQKMATAIESQIGTRELMMRMLTVGNLLGEHNDAGGGGAPEAGYMSPAEAKNEIAVLKADPDFMAKWHDGEPNAKQKMSSLHQLAYPG
jgi:hypothetical protein